MKVVASDFLIFLVLFLSIVSLSFGQTNPVDIEMIRVEGDTFIMGDTWGDNYFTNELPTHQVTVSSFYICKYEVTQYQYQEVMGSNPSYFSGENHPVENISWYDAVNFCNTLSTREGLTPCYNINGTNTSCNFDANGYRLPTEAEWSYAARGGKFSEGHKYAGSDNVNDVIWLSGNSGNQTHPVAQKNPNELGLYDMNGNVWEWCWDWWGGYSAEPQINPTGPETGGLRNLRGGSYNEGGESIRIAIRYTQSPNNTSHTGYPDFGFRLVRSIPNNPPEAHCKDIIVDAGNECEVSVIPVQVDDGSYDPDEEDTITLSLVPSTPLSVGQHSVALIVTDGFLYDTSFCSIKVTGGSGTFAGTVYVNDSGLGGVTVKLLVNDNPGTVIDETIIDTNGQYSFKSVPLGEYQLMVIEPLGYTSVDNFIISSLECGDTTVVDFALNEYIIGNEARGKGYWKHQFDVHVKGKGKAQETAVNLQNYIDEAQERYLAHFDLFATTETFEDWQEVLSVKGNAGMATKAKSHLASLLLNIMSQKLAQYEVVTEDGITAGDVLTYSSQLLSDNDPSNDELAKDIAEQVNKQQLIAAGIVPSGNVLYKRNGFNSIDYGSFIPKEFKARANYPNPFNPSTTISFDLPDDLHVTLEVYNSLGQKMADLVDSFYQAGYHSVKWDAGDFSSGIYYYRIKAGKFSKIMKMVLMK